jgi:hypothetical protein
MFGVRSFEPVGEKDYGLGSMFDVTLQLGMPLRMRIETVEFDEGKVIGMDSVKGFKARSRWHVTALDDCRTGIDATVSYDLPFGPAGKAMGRVMEPGVRRAVSYISRHLRENVEALARS